MRPALLTLLALAVLAGCGAARSGGAPAGMPPGASTGRDEILMLDGKILDWRREMGLEPAPPDTLWKKFWNSPRTPIAAQPLADVPDACRDVCTLADYICQAADDICRIAAELGDDEWARRKCANAKASCAEGRQRCSDCTRHHAVGADGTDLGASGCWPRLY
jgi:hypothetical protein